MDPQVMWSVLQQAWDTVVVAQLWAVSRLCTTWPFSELADLSVVLSHAVIAGGLAVLTAALLYYKSWWDSQVRPATTGNAYLLAFYENVVLQSLNPRLLVNGVIVSTTLACNMLISTVYAPALYPDPTVAAAFAENAAAVAEGGFGTLLLGAVDSFIGWLLVLSVAIYYHGTLLQVETGSSRSSRLSAYAALLWGTGFYHVWGRAESYGVPLLSTVWWSLSLWLPVMTIGLVGTVPVLAASTYLLQDGSGRSGGSGRGKSLRSHNSGARRWNLGPLSILFGVAALSAKWASSVGRTITDSMASGYAPTTMLWPSHVVGRGLLLLPAVYLVWHWRAALQSAAAVRALKKVLSKLPHFEDQKAEDFKMDDFRNFMDVLSTALGRRDGTSFLRFARVTLKGYSDAHNLASKDALRCTMTLVTQVPPRPPPHHRAGFPMRSM